MDKRTETCTDSMVYSKLARALINIIGLDALLTGILQSIREHDNLQDYELELIHNLSKTLIDYRKRYDDK